MGSFLDTAKQVTNFTNVGDLLTGKHGLRETQRIAKDISGVSGQEQADAVAKEFADLDATESLARETSMSEERARNAKIESKPKDTAKDVEVPEDTRAVSADSGDLWSKRKRGGVYV